MSGSVDVSARPIAEAGNFRRRDDGDWDYFLHLDSLYGYRVTLAQREALERLDKIGRGAGWVLGFFIVTMADVTAGKSIEGGLWIAGVGLVAWGLAVIAERCIRLLMLRDNTRVPIPLSEEEIAAISSAGASKGAASMLGLIVVGGIGSMIVPLLKQSGIHGLVAWAAAIGLLVGLWFALILLWGDMRGFFFRLFRGAQGRYRS